VKGRGFSEGVYRLICQIPPGKVTTYGAIARSLGKPRASRAVGSALGANPNPVIVPCHRVVKSDGTLGGYSSPLGIKRKIQLLADEGVELDDDGKVDMSRFLFTAFVKSDDVLRRARARGEGKRGRKNER
jgi:O-6-methylguanine DNA methyltransferase